MIIGWQKFDHSPFRRKCSVNIRYFESYVERVKISITNLVKKKPLKSRLFFALYSFAFFNRCSKHIFFISHLLSRFFVSRDSSARTAYPRCSKQLARTVYWLHAECTQPASVSARFMKRARTPRTRARVSAISRDLASLAKHIERQHRGNRASFVSARCASSFSVFRVYAVHVFQETPGGKFPAGCA